MCVLSKREEEWQIVTLFMHTWKNFLKKLKKAYADKEKK
jgi:hypothetical protein